MNSVPQSARGMQRRRFCAGSAALLVAGLLPGLVRADSFDEYFKAVKFDDVRKVADLLKRGFDPNAPESIRGETGLMIAAREGSMKVFRLLLDAPDIKIEARALNGDTALMLAAFKGNKEAVNALLDKGAEVNRPGWTPLHYAAAGGHDDIVAILLDKYAYIDAESPNKTTPIMMAALGGHIYTVKLLLDEGADATLKNESGMTAVDIARQVGRDDIADGLIFRLKRAGKL